MEIDMHYYMTTWLAGQTGGFSAVEAHIIGETNQLVDEDAATSSEKHVFRHGAIGKRKAWHFVTRERFEKLKLLVPHLPLEVLGKYLHPLQDYFAHTLQGWGPVFGHFRPLGNIYEADKMWKFPQESLAAIELTWDSLGAWIENKRPLRYRQLGGRKEFKKKFKYRLKTIKKYIDCPVARTVTTRSGLYNREINLKELMAKMKILGFTRTRQEMRVQTGYELVRGVA